jgi:hypothetical protein
MNPIESINQALAEHANNSITEADALKRVREIAGVSDQRLRLVIERTKSEIELHRASVRSHVESVVMDAKSLAREVGDHGPDAVSTTWVAMHVNGLIEAKTKLAASRETLEELERLLER